MKGYLGVYDGIDETGKDKERFTARVQYNLWDPEPGYFNLSTYLGKKKTLAIGASYDIQNSIAEDSNGESVDYSWWTVDTFLDHPVGDGFLTLEAAWANLDLDDATMLDDGSEKEDPMNPGTFIPDYKNGKETQGDGYYVQAGYLFPGLKWQPWALWEQWNSDDPGDDGSFDSFRIGLTYFIKGHNANVKLGYEFFDPEKSDEDEVNTILLGFYITY